MDFSTAFDLLIHHEGGFTADPRDILSALIRTGDVHADAAADRGVGP